MQASTNISQNNQYIMEPNNQVVNEKSHKGGRILIYQDNTEWFVLTNNTTERFCGYLYLQNALNEEGAAKIQAAENKVAIHNRQIVHLSRYYGDQDLDFENDLKDYELELDALCSVGFTDFTQSDRSKAANLRKKDHVIYVFDTEKSSFSWGVHKIIDTFANQYFDTLRILEKSL